MNSLPPVMKEIVAGKRKPTPLSPPLSFALKGAPDTEAEGFHDAIYGVTKKIEDYLEWGEYLTKERLPEPGSLFALERWRKETAEVARPLQCSLAIADLANHIGGPNQIDNLDKAALKELIQVMGALSRESAVCLTPKFDRSLGNWGKEKHRIREVVLDKIRPANLKIALEKSSLFCESLFPEDIFKLWDVKARDSESENFFPAYQRQFKRPTLLRPHDPTARKRMKPNPTDLPPKKKPWVKPQGNKALAPKPHIKGAGPSAKKVPQAGTSGVKSKPNFLAKGKKDLFSKAKLQAKRILVTKSSATNQAPAHSGKARADNPTAKRIVAASRKAGNQK